MRRINTKKPPAEVRLSETFQFEPSTCANDQDITVLGYSLSKKQIHHPQHVCPTGHIARRPFCISGHRTGVIEGIVLFAHRFWLPKTGLAW